MSARLSALLVWGLVAAAAVFWILRLTASSIPVPPATALAGTGAPSGADLGRLLGVRTQQVAVAEAPMVPDMSGRFKLTGVVAARGGSRGGVALISIDGQPARAYRVGEQLDPQLSLQSVALRSAQIGGADGSAGFTLELPPPPPPATGTLADASRPSAMAQVGVPPVATMPPGPHGMASPPPVNPQGMASIVGTPPGAPPALPPQAPPPGMAEAANEEARMRALAR